MDHKLVDGTLKTEEGGITARCSCGWASGGHFSSLAASATFQDHCETEEQKQRYLMRVAQSAANRYARGER